MSVGERFTTRGSSRIAALGAGAWYACALIVVTLALGTQARGDDTPANPAPATPAWTAGAEARDAAESDELALPESPASLSLDDTLSFEGVLAEDTPGEVQAEAQAESPSSAAPAASAVVTPVDVESAEDLPLDAARDAEASAVSDATAKEQACGHQIWLISSRHITSCGDLNSVAEKLRYWRHQCGSGWIVASKEEFLAADDPAMPTAFYVHGHRVDPGYARTGGLDAYRAFVRNSATPTRFVIWSWPTTPQGRPLEDFRIRADTSEVHSYYLAWLIDQLDPSIAVHLVGYSYGARFITGSLHYLGGGVLMGRALDERVHPSRAPLRASLLASALDNDWLIPGRRHGQALSQVDRLLITKNPLDPVLHFYPVVLRDRSAVAMGVSGFAGLSRIGAERQKVEQLNVSRSIGKHHTIDLYWQSGRVTSMLRSMIPEGGPVEMAAGVGGE
ncbi:MAG: hypothetical protein JNG90_03875 [Planctomycetaceae bacterium]|nr:hypothetical protein [Planctomycetaceae bacterium]